MKRLKPLEVVIVQQIYMCVQGNSIQNETTKEHITADNGRNVKFLRPLEKVGKKTQSNADEPMQW